jgi:hypothetical protein
MFFEVPTLQGCLGRYNFKPVEITTLHCFSYGSRQKQVIARNRFVKIIWERVRRNRSLYAVKNLAFKILDKYQLLFDREKLNRNHLICIAQSQQDGKNH